MKKLMTILGATATLFASCVVYGEAEPWETGTSFENYTGDFNPQLNDSGEIGNTYWYTGDTAPTFVLTNYEVVATTTPTDKRPDKFKNYDNGTYLMIETSSPDVPLFRSALPYLGGITGDNVGKFSPVTNTADKTVYLDTLVKFTESDSVFSKNLSDGDKIAIEYVERDEELDPEDESIIKVHGITNFVIRAGFIGGPQTNYVAKLPANFDKNEWHRLTVRTVLNIDGNNSVGFVIYVDEEALEYDTDTIARTGEFAATAGDFTPAGVAANFYKDDYRALYPSVIQSGVDKFTISAAGFSGNGSVDDVTFTTGTPNFIKAGEQVRTEITLGTGVAAVTVTVGGNTVNPEDATANPRVFNLPAGTTSFVLGVTADETNGYTFDETTGITLTDATYATADDTVTITGASPALTVKGTRNNVTYIDGEDQQQSSSSLATALAAAKAGSTITLAYSVDVADIEGSAFETYEITSGKNLVLDLNGKTITWNDDQGEEALFTVRAGASFRVIDSSVANTGAIVYTGEYVVFYNKGNCYIGATTGDNGPTIQGKLAANKAEAQIVRGKFDKATNGTVEFTWADYIEEGSELVESLGDYWIVAPTGGGDEDWKDPSEITKDATAGDTYGITGDLAAADAVELTEWATGVGSVTFANKDTINIDCFLLNIANNSTAQEIQDEKDEFIVNISFDSVTGEPVVTTPDGKTYNGKFKVYGSDDLTTPKASWHEQTDGDTFFYGKLVP